MQCPLVEGEGKENTLTNSTHSHFYFNKVIFLEIFVLPASNE